MVRGFRDAERQLPKVLLEIQKSVLLRQELREVVVHILVEALELPPSFREMKREHVRTDLFADDEPGRLALNIIDSSAKNQFVITVKGFATREIIRGQSQLQITTPQ